MQQRRHAPNAKVPAKLATAMVFLCTLKHALTAMVKVLP